MSATLVAFRNGAGPFAVAGLWHAAQLFRRTGLIDESNSTAGSPASTTPAKAAKTNADRMVRRDPARDQCCRRMNPAELPCGAASPNTDCRWACAPEHGGVGQSEWFRFLLLQGES